MSKNVLFRRFLRNPVQVGALCPSSRALCSTIVSQVGVDRADVIVELGPGTGAITREIILRMLFALMSACELLGFDRLAALVAAFLVFGGNIIVGIIVMMIGIYLANLAADVLKGKSGGSEFLAAVTRIAVLIFTGAIALSTLNLNGRIVEIAFALLLGAICVAIAIAFGLGGREFAAKKLEEWDKKLTKK